MSVSLQKGSRVNLSKQANECGITLSNVNVGLGWDCNIHSSSSFDLDAWALAVTDDGCASKKNLVYYGNKHDTSNNIRHCGDNLTGAGDGDDETITMNIGSVPDNYKFIIVGVNIFRGKEKRQCFRNIDNTFVRVYDTATGLELCRYSDKFYDELGDSTSMIFGVFTKINEQWEFNAVGKPAYIDNIVGIMSVFNNFIENNINGGKKTMAVNLSKGGKVSLAKVAADAGLPNGLNSIIVGLGWDTNRYDGGADFDLDAAAFMLNESGKVRDDSDFIFYNNKTGAGIEHTGDNRTGEGDGDDEQIKLNLSAVPADVNKIDFTVTIDQADVRNQNFGMVENSYIRVVDEATGTELIRYDLGEDFSIETAVVVAELYRHDGEWKFNAIGSGFSGGLAALCRNFGVNI